MIKDYSIRFLLLSEVEIGGQIKFTYKGHKRIFSYKYKKPQEKNNLLSRLDRLQLKVPNSLLEEWQNRSNEKINKNKEEAVRYKKSYWERLYKNQNKLYTQRRKLVLYKKKEIMKEKQIKKIENLDKFIKMKKKVSP